MIGVSLVLVMNLMVNVELKPIVKAKEKLVIKMVVMVLLQATGIIVHVLTWVVEVNVLGLGLVLAVPQ
jgi:hypothetical protein